MFNMGEKLIDISEFWQTKISVPLTELFNVT
jgi:hypothetical protein